MNLTSLDLSGSILTDESLNHLKLLYKLTYLNLFNCYGRDITHLGFSSCLLALTELTSLNMKFCTFETSIGLPYILSNVIKLTSLDLCSYKKLDDAGLSQISSLTNLTSLNLSYCPRITDAGVFYLSTLTKLKSLDLSYCYQITALGYTYVRHTQLVIHYSPTIDSPVYSPFSPAYYPFPAYNYNPTDDLAYPTI